MAHLSQPVEFAGPQLAERDEIDQPLDDGAERASGSDTTPAPVRPWRSGPVMRVLSLTPFALALYADFIVRPTFGGGIFATPPVMIGIPLGLVLQVAFLAMAAAAALEVWRSRSRRSATVAFVVLTPISLVGILFTPAIILILRNLS